MQRTGLRARLRVREEQENLEGRVDDDMEGRAGQGGGQCGQN